MPPFLPRSAGRPFGLAALGAVLLFTLAACGTAATSGTSSGPTTPSSAPPPSASNATSPAIYVAQNLRPSVVDVSVADAQGQELGLGSGVIYRQDGYIVTNNHVVTAETGQPAASITVTLATGERFGASLIGRDPLSDLAVIRIKKSQLPAATFLTNMSEVQVGQYAFAVGTPLGLQGSVTMGIVSAMNREVPASGSLGTVDLIQTDAAISPGNSGGALADEQARVIGINVAAASIQANAQNIGFAIPADTVSNIVNQLIKSGKVTYGYLGIQATSVTPSLQQQYNLSRDTGALVVGVQSGSPAANADIRQGDIIIKIGDRAVSSEVDLFAYLRTQQPGTQVPVVLVRDGKEQTVQVTLGQRPGG